MIRSIKKIWHAIALSFGDYVPQIGLLTLLGFVASAFDVIGVGALIPLLSFALGGQNVLGNDSFSRVLSNLLRFFGANPRVSLFLGIIVLMFVLKALVLLVIGYVNVRIQSDYETKIRLRLYKTTLASRWSFLLEHEIGTLENLIMQQVKATSSFLGFVSGTVKTYASFLVYISVALRLNFTLSMTLIFAGILLAVCSQPLVRFTRRYSRDQRDVAEQLSHEINENVIGLKSIKSLGAEEPLVAEGKRLFALYNRNKINGYLVKAANSFFLQPLSVVFICLLFYIEYKQPGFDIGIFAVSVYLIQKIFAFIDDAQSNLHAMASLAPFVLRINSHAALTEKNRELDTGVQPFVFRRELSFEKVVFSYRGAQVPALDQVSFRIPFGSTVGVIGPSGAGKTTLSDLFLRLFNPLSGEIRIDGVPLRDISLSQWRKHVGYVSQEQFLKNMTIRENVRFFDVTISDSVIWTALDHANLAAFVRSLPQGLDTIVGERGGFLSGGQRQRLALARVLSRNPSLIVLDEPTSALDAESEAAIREVLLALKGSVTILIIAHRISTLSDADVIIALTHGRIAEIGTPSELAANPDSYFARISRMAEENTSSSTTLRRSADAGSTI